MATLASLLRTLLSIICFLAIGAQGLSWGGARRGEEGVEASTDVLQDQQSSAYDTGPEPRLSNTVMITLNELQELESEPLCFRTAARLLINNCQVLDGQDDATILTNADQVARDFVDSFAASLAICDLERGRFQIPSACSQFRESTLSSLSPSSKPQLHVTTAQIDECLEGLAQSDSTWNTWVAYKQKAMRFVMWLEATTKRVRSFSISPPFEDRTDLLYLLPDQTIKIHQKITQILAKFCTQVEKDIASHFESMAQRARDTWENVEKIQPQVTQLNVGVVEAVNNAKILTSLGLQATDIITRLVGGANVLEDLFAMIVRKAQEHESEMDTSHQVALRVSTNQVAEALGPIHLALATIAASALSSQIAVEHTEEGLGNMNVLVDTISTKNEGVLRSYEDIGRLFEDVDRGLKATIQQVSEIAGTINLTAQAAATLHNFAPDNWRFWLSLWSYVVSPIAYNIGAARRWLLPILSFLLSGTANIMRWIVSAANRFRTRSREQITLLESNEDALDNSTLSSHVFIPESSGVLLEEH